MRWTAADEVALAKLAATQHGVFSAAQAAALGFTKQMLSRRTESGLLRRVASGVYRHAGASNGPNTRLQAACLFRPDDGTICLGTAAHFFGLTGFRKRPAQVDLSTALTSSTVPWLKLRRLDLQPHHRMLKDGIWVTTPARTICDLARWMEKQALENTLDDAVRKELTSVVEVMAVLAESKRWMGGDMLRASLLDRRVWGGKVPWSGLENVVIWFTRERGFPRPEISYPMLDQNDDFLGYADLAWPEHRVIVEVDSEYFHGTRAAKRRDDRRDRVNSAHGWNTVRVRIPDLKPDAGLPERLVAAGLPRAKTRIW